jgi:hypothetical protein
MEITGKITGIKYKVSFAENLKSIDIGNFNINESPAFCLVKDAANSFAISKWVSPKRTRSYPYERVYNTLNSSKKITVIPIVKDEGARGDRDFLIESKHSANSILPSKGDIKDGLLKMILYSNLCEVEVDGVKMKSKAILKLTSNKLTGSINEKSYGSERAEFIFVNNLKGDKQLLISELFKEAEENGFEVRISKSK